MKIKEKQLKEIIIVTIRNRYWRAGYYESPEYIIERVWKKLKDIFYQGELNFTSDYNCIDCVEFCFREIEKEIQEEIVLMQQEYGM